MKLFGKKAPERDDIESDPLRDAIKEIPPDLIDESVALIEPDPIAGPIAGEMPPEAIDLIPDPVQAVAAATPGPAASPLADDPLGGASEGLMSLFESASSGDTPQSALAVGLDDVPISDIVSELREVAAAMGLNNIVTFPAEGDGGAA